MRLISLRSYFVFGIWIYWGFLYNHYFAQSKKQQIQFLHDRLEGLKKVQSEEKIIFDRKKSEMELSILNLNQKSVENSKIIAAKREEMKIQSQKNLILDQEILALKLEKKTIYDSIQKIIDERPIQLLGSNTILTPDEELIKLFDLNINEIETEGCLSYNNFVVVGKQNFINGKDTMIAIVIGAICSENLHPITGTNYICLFKKNKNKFSRVLMPIQASASFGFGGCAELEGFGLMGRKSLYVILNGGYYGMGISEENRSIYLINNLTITNVLEIEKHYDDSANEGTMLYENIVKDWEINFIDNHSEYFDIEVKEKSHGKKIKITNLKFNHKTMKYE